MQGMTFPNDSKFLIPQREMISWKPCGYSQYLEASFLMKTSRNEMDCLYSVFMIVPQFIVILFSSLVWNSVLYSWIKRSMSIKFRDCEWIRVNVSINSSQKVCWLVFCYELYHNNNMHVIVRKISVLVSEIMEIITWK